jgi:hypothetical protein
VNKIFHRNLSFHNRKYDGFAQAKTTKDLVAKDSIKSNDIDPLTPAKRPFTPQLV